MAFHGSSVWTTRLEFGSDIDGGGSEHLHDAKLKSPASGIATSRSIRHKDTSVIKSTWKAEEVASDRARCRSSPWVKEKALWNTESPMSLPLRSWPCCKHEGIEGQTCVFLPNLKGSITARYIIVYG